MSEKKTRPYKHPQINLRIPEELKEKIQELADKHGRSMNAEIIHILKSHINDFKNSPSITVRTIKQDDGTIEIKKAELMSISDAILNAIEKSQNKKIG